MAVAVRGAQQTTTLCDEAPANAIVAENCLPGSPMTEWDVNGAGTDDVVGFTTQSSYAPGETVELKVSTTEATKYDVDFYRLGWYGGLGARKVGALTDVAGTPQPACLEENEVVDCGNWAVSARFALPANATSGLYAARLILDDLREDWRADASKIKYDPVHVQAGRDPRLPPEVGAHTYASKFKLRNALERPRASLAYFVVREDAKHHALLFQTADTTWHAYNGWGGLTTYGSFEYPKSHAPNRSLVREEDRLRRAFKRSYNTPLVTRDYRAVNAPFGAEYPAIRFLEKLGVDLHYVTGHDLSRRNFADEALARSQAYLSVGHDEYWSHEQRAAVEAAQANGTHTFFWSGNEAYWAVRFEAPRTMVCYKETQSQTKLDPKPGAWTGTFRDARPINPRGPLPENAVTGVMFAANAQRNDPLVVDTRRFGRHRLWRHTSIARSPTTRVVLYAGLLGHEWDSPVDNGWSPAGLQRLSETTIDNVQAVQDWGATFDSGTATHSLALHRKGGALVFGAGTVQWSWGLDEVHDVNDPQRANKYNVRVAADPRGPCPDVQQFTVNLFADAGISSMPGLRANFPHLTEPRVNSNDDDTEPPTAAVSFVSSSSFPSDDDDDVVVVVVASGRASDLGGGAVASVEIAWPRSGAPERWFLADVDAIAPETTWSFRWGHELWHRFHGPAPPTADLARNISLRVSDDSGNLATYAGLAVVGDSTAPMDEL